MRVFGRGAFSRNTPSALTLLLTLLVGATVIITATESSRPSLAQAPSPADQINAITRAINESGPSSPLANFHHQKQISCTGCHGTDIIPDANATAINAQCSTCHGGMEKVALTHKGPTWLNPHASHLGNIPCAACHMGHVASKPYCLNCHANFDMPIPGGIAKAAPP